MNHQDIKQKIQELLEVMKVEGRKPAHVENMRELLILRDKHQPSPPPVITKNIYDKKSVFFITNVHLRHGHGQLIFL